jgi:hypothetical protein
MRARFGQLKMDTHGLRLNVEENFNRNYVLSFYNNILAARRINAFRGKPTLWDFLQDVSNNLNCKKQGHRFSKNTKSFGQAMKVYGGVACVTYFLSILGPLLLVLSKGTTKGVSAVNG